jgi:hypothetical protein
VSLRRLLAAGAACAAIAAVSSSCTAIIGGIGDDDKIDVVTTLCSCGGDLDFLGTKEQCRDYLVERFDGMTADERQSFLEFYAEECKTCDTAKKCYYRAPLCRDVGCRRDEECCSFSNGGVCNDDGTCS